MKVRSLIEPHCAEAPGMIKEEEQVGTPPEQKDTGEPYQSPSVPGRIRLAGMEVEMTFWMDEEEVWLGVPMCTYVDKNLLTGHTAEMLVRPDRLSPHYAYGGAVSVAAILPEKVVEATRITLPKAKPEVWCGDHALKPVLAGPTSLWTPTENQSLAAGLENSQGKATLVEQFGEVCQELQKVMQQFML